MLKNFFQRSATKTEVKGERRVHPEERRASLGEASLRDFRFAVRQLVKNPGFTAVAVITLALGISACLAIFSVVNAVMLRPLPYAEENRLVRLYTEFPGFPNGGLRRFSFSTPEYLEMRAEARSWESLDAWMSAGVNIGVGPQSFRIGGAAVTGSLLRSLGVTPALGRLITPEDDVPGGQNVAVISHGLWQRAFGGDRNILGRDLLVDGTKWVVVGVMREDFHFPPGETSESEIWGPIQINPAQPAPRVNHALNLLGRLRSGVTLGQAQAEIRTLEKHWGEIGSDHRLNGNDHTVVSYGLHDEVVRGVRPALRMLMGAVVFLLLIACVNVANLLLGRAEARRREIAIRGVMGAGLGRLGLQFVIEGLLLASTGVVAGLLLAQGGMAFLRSAALSSLPRTGEVGIDARVGIFAAALALVAGVAFGLAPLAHVVRRNLKDAMNSGSSISGSAGTQQFRQFLVVGQLALSLTLLIGTGLMIRAFWNLQKVDAGFDPKNIVTMSLGLPDSAYQGMSVLQFWTRLETQLDSIPAIHGAALASGIPPAYSETRSDTIIEGYVPTQGAPPQNVQFYQSVSSGYFETMRIRLAQGRFFDQRDSAEAPEVAIINQSMARTFWGSESAVGRRIRPSGTTNWCTVVGVVEDVKNAGLEKPAGTELYLPLTQKAGLGRAQQMFIIARAGGNPATIVTAVRREVSRMDPTLPLADVRDMETIINAAQSRPRLFTLLLAGFGFVALVLASVGIYGVIAYAVARRTKELGLRMALGARRGEVFRMVLVRGMLIALGGIGVGLAGAFILTRFMSSLLFGVTPTDPATFFMVSLAFSLVAFLAIYLPARRATLIDPMEALRHE